MASPPVPSTTAAQACWTVAPGRAEIRSETLPALDHVATEALADPAPETVLSPEAEADLMRSEGSTLGRVREWSPSPAWPTSTRRAA